MPPTIAKPVRSRTRNLLRADHSMTALITCRSPGRDAGAGGPHDLAALADGDGRLPGPGHGDLDLARVLSGGLRLERRLRLHGGHGSHLRHGDAHFDVRSRHRLALRIGDLHTDRVLA